jgi:hypothetical protein
MGSVSALASQSIPSDIKQVQVIRQFLVGQVGLWKQLPIYI